MRIKKRGFVLSAQSARQLYIVSWSIGNWGKFGAGLTPDAGIPAKGTGQGLRAFMDRASGDGPPGRASFIALPGAAWGQRRDLPLRTDQPNHR